MTNTATATVIPRKTRSDHFTDTGKSQPVSVVPRILSDIESNTRKLLAMFEAGIVHTDMVKSQIKASGREAEKLQWQIAAISNAKAKPAALPAANAMITAQVRQQPPAPIPMVQPLVPEASSSMPHPPPPPPKKQGAFAKVGKLAAGAAGAISQNHEIADAVGLAIGGPIYGIYKEFKEFGKTVVDAMPSKDEKGDLPGKKTGGRDEFERFAATAKEQTGVSKDILAATKAVESAIVDSAPPEKTKQAAAVQTTVPDMLPTATAEVHPRQQESQNDIVKAIIHDIHHTEESTSKKDRKKKPQAATAEVTQKDTRQKSAFKAATVHQPPAVPGAASGIGSGGILGSVKQAAVDIAGAKTLGYLGKTRVGKMAMGAVEKVGNLRAATAEKAASLAGRATEGVFNVGGKAGGTIAKMLPAAGRLLEPLSAVAKVVGKVAWPLAAITAGYGAYQGYNDKEGQAKAFDLKKEDAATIGQKIAMAVATTMDKGTFGIFSGLGNMMGIDFKSALAKNVKDSVNPFSVGEQAKGVWTSIRNFGQAVTGTRTKENAVQLDAAEAKKADAKVVGKVAWPLAAITAGYDAYQGYNDKEGQAKAFDLKKEDAATIGQKIAMAVATTMDKGTFGIFSGLGNMMGIDFKSALAKNVKDSVNPFSVGEQAKGVWTSIRNFGQAVTGTRTKENAVQLDAAEAKKADAKVEGKYPSAPAYSGLGSISAKNESNGDPGMVNDNDVGKAAYGTFQMRDGEATRFIQQSKWANDFKGLKEGTPEFKQKWQATAGKKGSPQSAEFAAAQKARIKQTHYDPVAARAQELGIDTSSPAIQEALWSTGVQHGAGGGQNILTKAMSGVDAKTLSKADVITRINAERGRTDMNGNLVHFTKVKSEGGKKALLNRFSSENQQETAMAYNETKTPAVMPVATADVATAAKPQHIQTSTIETPVVRPQVQAFKPEAQKAGATSADTGSFFDKFSDYMKNNSGSQAGQRSTPSSQPQKTTSNIPMEFDDTLLTLMAYDRI